MDFIASAVMSHLLPRTCAGTNCWELPERVGRILVAWLQQGRPTILADKDEEHLFLSPTTACGMDSRRFSEFVGNCFKDATGDRLTQQMLRRIFAKGAPSLPLFP
jgi:site-specific recombinase XerD